MSLNNRNLNKEVSIEYPLYQSEKGLYFIGQTPLLNAPNSKLIGALVNPKGSNANIFLNAITVTNTSNNNLSAEIYLRSTPPIGYPSQDYSCTNVTIVPPPKPNGEIHYNNIPTNQSLNGVPIFSRIVSGMSTLVIDGGQIIIPPNSCILVYLGGFLPIHSDCTILAFGWWEEYSYKHCHKNHISCC